MDMSDLRQKHPQHFEQPEQPPFEVTPAPQTWVNRTSRSFVGGIGSGNGVNVTAEDDLITITSAKELPRAKVDEAIAAGFNDKSVDGLTILEGDKRKIREIGKLNSVVRSVISADEGRGR